MSIRRLNREIDSREFGAWQAYGEIEPFGPLRDDLRAGTIAAVIANVNRDPHRRPEPFLASTFFTSLAEPEPELPDDAALERKLLAWAVAMKPPTPATPARRYGTPKVR